MGEKKRWRTVVCGVQSRGLRARLGLRGFLLEKNGLARTREFWTETWAGSRGDSAKFGVTGRGAGWGLSWETQWG
eukprot:scaffold296707_cov24-Tisochrysis_lutea.AAC.1